MTESDAIQKYGQRIQAQREFEEKVLSKISDKTIYKPVAEFIFSVDLEGDGKIDAYIGHVGARPGGIQIWAPK